MASESAKRVAGTYIADEQAPASPVLSWLRQQARRGVLAESVRKFCADQPEQLDPELVQIEGVDCDCIQCRIPMRIFDHESPHTFGVEARFLLNPATGASRRMNV